MESTVLLQLEGLLTVLDPRDPPHLLSFLGDKSQGTGLRGLGKRAHTLPQNEKEGLKK